jgi:type IV secretory pathway VirB10-like protein
MKRETDVPKEGSMDWFQAILLALLLIALAYWVYGRFISSQRRVEETPPVRKEVPVHIEAQKERPDAAVKAVAPPVREEVRVRTEEREEKSEAAAKAIPPPAKKKVLPAEHSGLAAMSAEARVARLARFWVPWPAA